MTEEKKAHSVDGTAVTINVSVQQDGSTRTGPMLGLRLCVHKQTGEHGEIKDAIRVMSDHTTGKMFEIINDICLSRFTAQTLLANVFPVGLTQISFSWRATIFNCQ